MKIIKRRIRLSFQYVVMELGGEGQCSQQLADWPDGWYDRIQWEKLDYKKGKREQQQSW